MKTLLLRFEAFESRIAPYCCPRGISGRLHTLRLRRCFQDRRGYAQALAVSSTIEVEKDERRKRLGGYEDEGRIDEGAFEKEAVHLHERYNIEGGNWASEAGRNRSRHRKIVNYSAMPIKHANTLGDVILFEEEESRATLLSRPSMTALRSALRRQEPHEVLKILLDDLRPDASGTSGYMLHRMPPTMFSEVLRCLNPENFIPRYQELHMQASSAHSTMMGLGNLYGWDSYYALGEVLFGQISNIIGVRNRSWPLALSDYKQLLRFAQSCGRRTMLEDIWNSMHYNGIVPDSECYNIYLMHLCWSERFDPKRRFRLRVIPFHLLPRTWNSPPYSLGGHKIGDRVGIKANASRLFREMIEQGISGNEETFSLLMVAMAREADLDNVETLLQRVWGIDVGAIMTGDDLEIPPPKHFSSDSPFYPSEKLLFTIAHIYGINNKIPTALKIVDFISRQYSIKIPRLAWSELLRWTFVLSLPRNKTTRWRKPARKFERLHAGIEAGEASGHMPPEAVTNLWFTMVSEPYNVKPTMEMYDMVIRNLKDRQRWGDMEACMKEAYRRVLKKEFRALSWMYRRANTAMYRRLPKDLRNQWMRDLLFRRLQFKRHRLYVRTWVRHLLKSSSKSMPLDTWSSLNIPCILESWSSFLPRVVEYKTDSGEVRLRTQSTEHNTANQIKFAQRNRWQQLDGLRREQWRAQEILGREKRESEAQPTLNSSYDPSMVDLDGTPFDNNFDDMELVQEPQITERPKNSQ